MSDWDDADDERDEVEGDDDGGYYFENERNRVCRDCACYPGDDTCYCWHPCSDCGGVIHNSEGDRCITCRTRGLGEKLFPREPREEGSRRG